MKHILKSTVLLGALITVSACGGASTGMTGMTGGGGGDVGVDPTFSVTTVNGFSGNYSDIRNQRATPTNPVTGAIPIGNFDYSGRFKTDLDVAGDDSVDGLYGRIAINADLAGPGDDVVANLTDIHTLSGNTPQELLVGSLRATGTFNGLTKEMVATLSGSLNGVMGDDGEAGTLNFNGRLAGVTRDEFLGSIGPIDRYDNARNMSGSITGSVSGSESANFSGLNRTGFAGGSNS